LALQLGMEKAGGRGRYGREQGEVYFTLPLQDLLHSLLHAGGEANSRETQGMNGKTEVIGTRPKLGERRERPHPLTHRASRVPWSRSRLSLSFPALVGRAHVSVCHSWPPIRRSFGRFWIRDRVNLV